MRVLFYIDPESGQAHIARHNGNEQEVDEILRRPMEDRPGAEGSRVALGRTAAGRYLRVVYVRDPEPDSVFVFTNYDFGAKAKRALPRRAKRRP